MDIAHAGLEWRRHKNPADAALLFGQSLLDLPRTMGRVILTSQRQGEVSKEQLEQGHGVFMTHLLDALEGGDFTIPAPGASRFVPFTIILTNT